MTTQVGNLYRKRTVRRLSGQIIDMVDEANGGKIISNGNVVNQERYEELQKIEEDKKLAALAMTQAVSAPAHVEAQRTSQPGKIEELEKRLNAQDEKLDAILAALKK